MKVRCVYTSHADVLPPLDPCKFFYESTLHLIKDKVYIVYGIIHVKEKGIHYLIQEETFYPSCYTAALFEIVDAQLPYDDWFFYHDEDHLADFRLGYKLFALDQDHFEKVILHDDRHVALFEEWRARIDQQYKQLWD